MNLTTGKSIDQREIERFSALAREWWDPRGKFAALHRLNPVRLGFVREHAIAHFGLDANAPAPLTGLAALDIGCGGGLLSEPIARMGASVTGIDPGGEGVETARIHAKQSGLEIDYRAASAEDLAAAGEKFDIVLNMEVIEHVADVEAFMAASGALVAPGGMMFLATINRTLKAFALAIVGAEFVLGWVPRGTHSWEKFVTPAEAEDAMARAGLSVVARAGMIYNPLGEGWKRGRDMDVNYILAARRQ